MQQGNRKILKWFLPKGVTLKKDLRGGRRSARTHATSHVPRRRRKKLQQIRSPLSTIPKKGRIISPRKGARSREKAKGRRDLGAGVRGKKRESRRDDDHNDGSVIERPALIEIIRKHSFSQNVRRHATPQTTTRGNGNNRRESAQPEARRDRSGDEIRSKTRVLSAAEQVGNWGKKKGGERRDEGALGKGGGGKVGE